MFFSYFLIDHSDHGWTTECANHFVTIQIACGKENLNSFFFWECFYHRKFPFYFSCRQKAKQQTNLRWNLRKKEAINNFHLVSISTHRELNFRFKFWPKFKLFPDLSENVIYFQALLLCNSTCFHNEIQAAKQQKKARIENVE